jgi:hypothetical protein
MKKIIDGDLEVVGEVTLDTPLPVTELAITGTPDGTKFLRDDGTWQTATDAAAIPLSQKGAASGVATLDASSLLPVTELPASGATAATYGDATHVPQIAVDVKGRVTAASNVAITVSSGVASFNTRTGAVVPATGDYTVAQVTGAAPLASPAITGTPTAPTASPGTNTTQLATTAFVAAAVTGSGSSTLAGDTDVSIATPQDSQILLYTSADSKWHNKTLSLTSGFGAPGWNPADKNATVTLSGTNNNTATVGSGSWQAVRAVTPMGSGKYYYEFKITAYGANYALGFANATMPLTDYPGEDVNGVCTSPSDGGIWVNGGETIGTTTGALNDRICIAVDTSAKLVWFRTNGGNWNNSGTANPATATGGVSFAATAAGPYYPCFAALNTSDAAQILLYPSDFTFTAPSGFGAVTLPAINAMADVNVTAPSTGQVMSWNGAYWTNSTPAAGGVTSFKTRTGAVVPATGDYAVADITGAAPLASPALTGTPTAPTASPGTNTTQLATTAFVIANSGGTVWRQSVNRSLATTALAYTEIGKFSGAMLPAGNITVSLATSQANYVATKQWTLAPEWNGTGGVYQIVVAEHDSGASNGNDLRLEALVSTADVTIRLVRVSGSTVASCNVTVEYGGSDTPTWTSLTGTGTSAITAVYARGINVGALATGSASTGNVPTVQSDGSVSWQTPVSGVVWRQSINRTVPATANAYAELGTLSGSMLPAGNIVVALATSQGNYVESKRWVIVPEYNGTAGVYEIVEPQYTGIDTNGNAVRLEVAITGASTVTLRLARTSGTTSGSCNVTIEYLGSDSPTWSALTGTGTSAITAVYPNKLRQAALQGGSALIIRAVSSTANTTIELGSYNSGLSNTGGTHSVRVALAAGGSGYGLAKQYLLVVPYNCTAASWNKVLPIRSTTVGIALDLEVNGNGNILTFRLRQTGTTAANIFAEFEYLGDPSVPFVESTTTSTSAVTAAVNTGDTSQYTINFPLDGAGSVLVAGDGPWVQLPAAGTIIGAVLVTDNAGSSLSIDLYTSDYTSFPTFTKISATAPCAVASAQKSSSALTGWTTTVTAGQYIRPTITGTPAVATKAALTLTILRS